MNQRLKGLDIDLNVNFVLDDVDGIIYEIYDSDENNTTLDDSSDAGLGESDTTSDDDSIKPSESENDATDTEGSND